MEIRFQAVAHGSDGILGQVTHVLIDQRSWKLCFLVVKGNRRGDLDWLVPLDRLQAAQQNGVWLRGSLAELRQADPFTVLNLPFDNPYDKPMLAFAPNLYPPVLDAIIRHSYEPRVPKGCQVLYWGTQVDAEEVIVGRLGALRFEPRHQMLSALVIARGRRWFKREWLVPARNIEGIEAERVFLNLDRKQLEAQQASSRVASDAGWQGQ